MRFSFCLLIAGSFTLAAVSADAQYMARYSKDYDQCMNKSGGVTSSMLACNDDEYRRQDKKLNEAYKKLTSLSQVSPKKRQQFREVERLWIAYTKANCDFLDQPDEGTAAAVASSSCYLEALGSRRVELEDLVEYYSNR